MTWHLWKATNGDDITSHTLTLLGVPASAKNNRPIHRNAATGKPFVGKSPVLRRWMNSAVFQLRSQWRHPPIDDVEIRAHVSIYQGKGQSIDADNAIAAAFDALQKAKVIRNDYQLACGSWDRHRDRERPRIEITLMPVGNPPGKGTGNGKQTTPSRKGRGRTAAANTKGVHPQGRRAAGRVR